MRRLTVGLFPRNLRSCVLQIGLCASAEVMVTNRSAHMLVFEIEGMKTTQEESFTSHRFQDAPKPRRPLELLRNISKGHQPIPWEPASIPRFSHRRDENDVGGVIYLPSITENYLSRRVTLRPVWQCELQLPATTWQLAARAAQEARPEQARFHRSAAIQRDGAARLGDQFRPKVAD